MLYVRFLKTLTHCPFCKEKKDPARVVKATKNAYLTYSLAPYSRYHLLVIPKRHVILIEHLTRQERREIDDLIAAGITALRKFKVKDCTVLVRNGVHSKSKSVRHLHYHIIPNHRVGDLDIKGGLRKILRPPEIVSLVARLRAATR